MILNELAQWAVLLFLTVFVVGLTRQLGNFLVPARARTEAGAPPVGGPIPDGLVPEESRRRLRALFAERDAGLAVVAAIEPKCEFCDALLGEIANDGVPGEVPLVIVGESTNEKDERVLGQLADVFVDDPKRKRAKGAGLSVSPFLLVVDSDLTIVHRQAGGTIREALERAGMDTLELVTVAPSAGPAADLHGLASSERTAT